MFHYSAAKKSGQDRNKNQHKFLDPKRDTHARLKALQRLLELQVDNEEKQFFQDHSTEIFYLFYEEFTNLEVNAKSKGAKLKDELEELLTLLEKIFINLPDELYSRWQFNCIGLILRKLLHHGNTLAIREHGLKLFMLWLLILQDKIDEFHLVVFGSVVPGFPSPIDKINIKETYRPVKVIEYVISCINGQGAAHGSFHTSLESETEWCVAEGGSAICPPQQGDKVISPDELTKKFLERLLFYMTSRMLDIQWCEKHKRASGFYHVFNHFKRFYLSEIFPLWDPADRLYSNSLDIINVPITNIEEDETVTNSTQTPTLKIQCQSAILGWLIKFTADFLRKPKLEKQSVSVTSTAPSGDEVDASKETPPPEPASIDDEKLSEIIPIVRSVLYATKDNVLLIHEIFRQGFLMPLSCCDIMVHILNVYREWFSKSSERPPFMREPKSLDIIASKEEPPPSPLFRSTSYKEAVIDSEQNFLCNIPVDEVFAGFHANLRLFIALTGQVFFVKQQKDILTKHADICKRVMKFYRNIVLEKTLDSLTWRQLLVVLLKIIDHIFTLRPPSPRNSTLGGQLGSYLLQTLFVTWVRASLEVYLTLDLWDELLRVGSSFTCWGEMITEWANTMETLTRVMARTVYGIDLTDPPLKWLTQRGNLRKFKKSTATTALGSKQSFPNWTLASWPSPATTPCADDKDKTLLTLGQSVAVNTAEACKEKKETSNTVVNQRTITVEKILEESDETESENPFADKFVPSK